MAYRGGALELHYLAGCTPMTASIPDPQPQPPLSLGEHRGFVKPLSGTDPEQSGTEVSAFRSGSTLP